MYEVIIIFSRLSRVIFMIDGSRCSGTEALCCWSREAEFSCLSFPVIC